jgi:ketosteroid isomerase-like protein
MLPHSPLSPQLPPANAPSVAAAPPMEDASAVSAAVLAMTRAFEAGQVDRVMDSYEPDAVVVFEPDAPARGTAALRAGFQAMSALAPKFSYRGHEVFVAGDIALHIAPWTMQALVDGGTLEEHGLSVAVFRRQINGGWKMLIDHPHGARLLGNSTPEAH